MKGNKLRIVQLITIKFQVLGGIRSIILRERRIRKAVVALGTHEEQDHASFLPF
jgi:hypothetical protein